MSNTDSSIEILLTTLRNNFLSEIPERCDGIEDNILALEKPASFSMAFEEVYRSIHSLKGSGGTIGLPIFTAISHQFEDLLTIIDGDFNNISQQHIDTMLQYNDLLKSTALQIVNENFDEESIRRLLKSVNSSSHKKETSGLIVEPSNMLSKAMIKEFNNSSNHLEVHVTTINSGFGALERLLNEKYDFLITSKELPILNGIALISALRNAESANSKIPCILTTSKEIDSSIIESLNITAVVQKDKQLVKNLATQLHKIKKEHSVQ